MITDKEILEYFIDKKRNAIISARINRNNLSKNFPQYKEYLEKRYEDFRGDYCEIIYRMFNGIDKIPFCKNCGKKLKYHGFKKNSYGTWCSRKCQLSDVEFIKERESKYTYDDKKKRLEKSKKTKLERYCDENFNNHKKFVNTCINKYGSTTPLSGKKRKEWENKLLADTGKKVIVNPKKTRETKLLKYGNETFCNRDKAQKTMLERYGSKTTLQSLYLKEKVRNTLEHKYGDSTFTNREKAEKTMIDKYGVTNPYQLESVRKKIDYKKILESKKNNGTFNSSKLENFLYEFLCEAYPNYTIIRGYEDERYKNIETGNNFQCDFYIKDLDLFIELNGHYTHGKHPFDKNNFCDLKLLEEYKAKSAPSYKNLIEVWTHRDVLKIEAAKRNDLNYITLYGYKINEDEIKEKISKYEKK